MSGKRIRFSDPTPNDQGLIIPNESIDFARYNLNPVLLCQHDWNAPPLGVMTDIRLDAGGWSGVPVFHKKTKASQEYAAMWEADALIACSIGGDAIWIPGPTGSPATNQDGHLTAKTFFMYEISMVTLPSNMNAVKLGAKVYEKTELDAIHTNIVTLSSKYKTLSTMETTTQTPEQELAAAEANVTRLKGVLAGKVKLGANNDPSYDQLPAVLKEIMTANASQHKENSTLFASLLDKVFTMFGNSRKPTKMSAPTPGKPTEESVVTDGAGQEQPTPIGLEAAKLAAEEAKTLAAKATVLATTAKAKATKAGATNEDKEAYATALTAANDAYQVYFAAEEAYKACMETEDDDATEMGTVATPVTAAAAAAATTALSTRVGKPAGPAAPASTSPKMKSPEELAAEGKNLAPKPEMKAKIGASTLRFSALQDPKNEEGQRILNRVTDINSDADLTDYAIILKSIMQEKKFAAIVDKTRIIANINQGQFDNYKRSSDFENRPGLKLSSIMAQLESGCIEVMGANNVIQRMTAGSRREMIKLTSTDNALAAPALNTIEWLSLAIFTLYPTTDWKNDIPMFGAQMTSQNTGIIWANIAADPAVYFGNQPVNPADYQYSDDAVSLTLIPSWLQPMLWTPLTMHQLRYDQMATGWAQAFAKWGSLIDDKLIYTLASTVPAGSIISTKGQKAANGPGAEFTLTGADDPNAFYYNPNLVTSLATPAYSDIIRTEQLYNRQNYNLGTERPRLVIDPTMEAFLCLDPFTQSLLTRWIDANREDLLKLKHTALNQRSRVAIYDPVSGQVKDPTGVIPPTAVSAAIGFLASQVALGLGILDVFMIQDPTAYGYRMSADIREGIVPVRKNYNGTLLYTYGTPPIA